MAGEGAELSWVQQAILTAEAEPWCPMKCNSNLRRFCAWAAAGLLVLFWVFVAGCAKALLVSNPPSQERLRLVAADAGKYTITVADKTAYSVPPDGRVTVVIPRLPSGDATYLVGVKVASASSSVSYTHLTLPTIYSV